jgi:hypothetical protein
MDINVVLNNPTGASDISLANRKLSLASSAVTTGTFPTLDYRFIDSATIITGVAETAGVWTVAFSAANDTTYKFAINQVVNGNPVTYIVSYTSDSSATAAEIAAAFVNQINAQTGLTSIQVTASGSGTPITLTADTGYPIFSVSAIQNMGTITNTVTGVAATGQGATLAAAGVSGATAGTTYTEYRISYYQEAAPQMDTRVLQGKNTLHFYVNQGDAQFAAFNTEMQDTLNALAAGVADPEIIAVGY